MIFPKWMPSCSACDETSLICTKREIKKSIRLEFEISLGQKMFLPDIFKSSTLKARFRVDLVVVVAFLLLRISSYKCHYCRYKIDSQWLPAFRN